MQGGREGGREGGSKGGDLSQSNVHRNDREQIDPNQWLQKVCKGAMANEPIEQKIHNEELSN